MPEFVISHEVARSGAIAAIQALSLEDRAVVRIMDGRKRKDAQNALSWVWYTHIAEETDKEEWALYRFALDGLDFRTRNLETLDEIERDALDFYARLRSLYRQRRDAEIRNDVDALSDVVAAAERID